MNKYLLFLLLCTFYVSRAHAQHSFDVPGGDWITLSDSDRTIRAEILPFGTKIRTYPDRIYHWVKGTTLHETRGAYAGHLLSGPYTIFSGNKSLLEKGVFHNGQKKGSWTSWNENGTYRAMTTWRSGKRNGPYSLYDEQGKLLQVGHFRNDQLYGLVLTRNAENKFTPVRYKRGVLLPSSRPNLISRIFSLTKKISGEKKIVEYKK